MIRPAFDADGRTGTQLLGTGIGTLLAVLVLASLAAPASALGGTVDAATAHTSYSEDAALESMADSTMDTALPDQKNVLEAKMEGMIDKTSQADRENVLKSGEFVLITHNRDVSHLNGLFPILFESMAAKTESYSI